MEPRLEAPSYGGHYERPTVATQGIPTVGHEVKREDYLLIYGPLGIMSVIFLAIIGVLWKAYGSQRKEFLADTKAKDAAHLESLEKLQAAYMLSLEKLHAQIELARVATAEVFRQLSREQTEAGRAMTDKWHDLVVGLRATLEATKNRIGRRE